MHKINIEHGLISLVAGNPIKGELLLGGDGWTCAMHRIEPKMARALAADLLKAAELIDPSQVKIERWLTQDDIDEHGNLWRWWSDQWTSGVFMSELAMVYVANGEVKICADNEPNWGVDDLSPGDYFTSIKGEK